MKIRKLIAFTLASVISLSAFSLSASATTKVTVDNTKALDMINAWLQEIDNAAIASLDYVLTDADKESTIAHIAKMKYYGKSVKTKPITSKSMYWKLRSYWYTQGVSSVTWDYSAVDSSTLIAWSDFDSINSKRTTTTASVAANYIVNVGNISSTSKYGTVNSVTSYKYGVTKTYTNTWFNDFVYAYRYEKSDIIKNNYDSEYIAFYNKCVSVLKECGVKDSSKTDMERAYAIAQWIRTNVTYSKTTTNCDSAFGAIYEGYAKCDGYADAFNLLMRMAGMKCWAVNGYFTNSSGAGGRHGWNVFLVNGEPVFIDAQVAGYAQYADKFYRTYDEMTELGYEFNLTEKEIKSLCLY